MSVFAIASCGDGGHGGGPSGDGSIGCQTDPRAMSYAAGMRLPGASGNLTFELVESNPAPPLKGVNTWSVELLDAAGHPVSGGTLDALPFMPDHGHGTQVMPQTTVAGDGYTITPLYLFMAGLWRVTLTATTSAGNDSVEFFFCIEG